MTQIIEHIYLGSGFTEPQIVDTCKRYLERRGYLVLPRHTEPPEGEGEYLALLEDNHGGRWRLKTTADKIRKTRFKLIECHGPLPDKEQTP